MNDIPKELIKQYQKEMEHDIESMAQHQEFCTRIFVLIEKHFNQSRLMTKSDFETYSNNIKTEVNIND
jgi:hypothetical protein|tara:strand:+ start:5023 stop:5226 length:204 start_codon:yes stop_codon:yes gene_type:complete